MTCKPEEASFSLRVFPCAEEAGIRNPVMAVIRGVSNAPVDDALLAAEIARASEDISDIIACARNTEGCSGFRKLFRKLGYPEQQGAFERLAESFSATGFKRISAVVDAANLASLYTGSPVGCHDFQTLRGGVIIRRAVDGDRILPLFQSKSRPVPAGDIIYEAAGSVVCWMGRKDVDSQLHAVTSQTTDIAVMAIGNEETDIGYNSDVCDLVFRYIRLAFPRATMQKYSGSGPLP